MRQDHMVSNRRNISTEIFFQGVVAFTLGMTHYLREQFVHFAAAAILGFT